MHQWELRTAAVQFYNKNNYSLSCLSFQIWHLRANNWSCMKTCGKQWDVRCSRPHAQTHTHKTGFGERLHTKYWIAIACICETLVILGSKCWALNVKLLISSLMYLKSKPATAMTVGSPRAAVCACHVTAAHTWAQRVPLLVFIPGRALVKSIQNCVNMLGAFKFFLLLMRLLYRLDLESLKRYKLEKVQVNIRI